MKLQERLDNLINQRDMLKEQYIKVAGAIELLEGMIEDEKKDDTKEKSSRQTKKAKRKIS